MTNGKKKWMIPLFVLAVVLILAAGAAWYSASHMLGVSTGRCYVTQNGDYLILLHDREPIRMANCSWNSELFAELNTGDEICILHDGILETYPGKTGVFYCRRLSRGTIADIPEQVLENLSPMGWIAVDDAGLTREVYEGTVLGYDEVAQDPGKFLLRLQSELDVATEITMILVPDSRVSATEGIAIGDRVRVICAAEASGFRQVLELTEYQTVSYEWGYANMALELPANWAWEIAAYEENEYAFGIHFWPQGQTEGMLKLEYYPDGFGVCGTGLEEEDLRLDNGLQAWVGTYDDHPVWDFIAIRELPGSYVFCTQNVDGWWDAYGEQAMEIIQGAALARDILWEDAAVEKAAQAMNTQLTPNRTSFDFCTGVWTIQYVIGGIQYNVPVSAEGVVGKIQENDPEAAMARKPVVYLYPEEETDVTLRLKFDGILTATYPEYRDGWRVTAHPDGTLVDKQTGRQYYCLFWEGRSNASFDLSSGFVVAGEETRAFLESALAQLGLTDREANEFIIYWLPQMEGNAYNLISFQQEAYTDAAVLQIDPAPDSLLRVFMAWKALETPVELPAQVLPSFERVGFTVVEWGGVCLSQGGD